jgi:hypothetical protein
MLSRVVTGPFLPSPALSREGISLGLSCQPLPLASASSDLAPAGHYTLVAKSE